jgi:protein-tyrosine kinase
MKHSRISLLERAAEAYDFAAALRAPTPTPATRPKPAEPPVVELAQPTPQPPVAEVAPRPAQPPRRAAPPSGRIAEVDRALLAEAGYIVPEAPGRGLAEEFRLLKRQLLAGIARRVSLPEEKRRSILICSPQSGDGKSFCTVNLGLSLAGERDLEVLLVDGDFAQPDLLGLLGIEGGPGLVDALADPSADPEDFVIRTDVAGLSVLPAGARANNVPELLASARTRDVLSRLVTGDPRRIVLFDSPPALMASPATVLAGHVGQALVVVRADRTTETDLRETVGLLSGCDHVALILNGAGIAVTGRNFGSYDGYGDGD